MSVRYNQCLRDSFGSPPGFTNASAGSDQYTLDATTEKLAWRFQTTNTTAIAAVDALLYFVGDTSGCTFKLGVFNDSSSAPGTLVGGYTDAFAGMSAGAGAYRWAGGSTGCISLTSNTGTMSANTIYWIVLEWVSGTVDASNYVKLRRASTYRRCGYSGSASYTGSWATSSNSGGWLVKDTNGLVDGMVFPVASGTDQRQLYGTTRFAWKVWVRNTMTVGALVAFSYSKTGSPGNLALSIFEEDTYKGQVIKTTNYSQITDILELSTPAVIRGGKWMYIVYAVVDSGGSGSAYYMMNYYSMGHQEAFHLSCGGDTCMHGTYTGHASDETLDTPHTSFTEDTNYYAMYAAPYDVVGAESQYIADGKLLINPGLSGGLR